MQHNDCCDGPLHYTSCWWCVYNDDGRPQATGDPEIDKELSNPSSPWRESFVEGYRGDLNPVGQTPALAVQFTPPKHEVDTHVDQVPYDWQGEVVPYNWEIEGPFTPPSLLGGIVAGIAGAALGVLWAVYVIEPLLGWS